MITRYVVDSDTLPYLETIEKQAQEIKKLRTQVESYENIVAGLRNQLRAISKRENPEPYKMATS